MSMTDPVADMLTRIRNACTAGHKRVDVPSSRFKAELARLLLEGVRRARRQREPALTRRRRREDDPAEVG